MLVGACIAGPPTVRGQILGSAGTANAGRASPAPTVKYRNSVYNHTRTSRPIVGVGLCSTRRAFPSHMTQKKDPQVYRLQVLSLGAPCASLSAAHNAKKDPQVYRLQVLSLGAPSAGALKNQCSALFLATSPREANASRIAAQHEAVPSVKS